MASEVFTTCLSYGSVLISIMTSLALLKYRILLVGIFVLCNNHLMLLLSIDYIFAGCSLENIG